MFPILLELGPIQLHTYGFLIAVGFIVAMLLVRRLSICSGSNPDRMMDLVFYGAMVGFLGTRILYVITRWDYFSNNLFDIVKVWQGGLVFYGGPIAVVPFFIWYLRKHKMNLWKAMDAAIPGLVIGHAFGRLGCFAAGCCYGKPTGTDFGVQFQSSLVDPALRGVALHPTQLYESGSLLLILIGLLWIFKRKVFDGQVVLSYFLIYPIVRSIIEVYRGDLIRGFVIDGVLSTSQFISILVFIGALLLLVFRLQKVKAHSGQPA